MDWHHFERRELCNGMVLYICKKNSSKTKQNTQKHCKLVHFLHQWSLADTDMNRSSVQVCVARELKTSMQQEGTKKKRQVVLQDMKRDVAFYAIKRGIPAARK